MSRNDRNGNTRRKLRSRVKAMGLPCALCGHPIDYALPAGDPLSYELDEITPVALGGSELDPNNVQPAHRICNQRKGKRMHVTFVAPGIELTDAAATEPSAPPGNGSASASEGETMAESADEW